MSWSFAGREREITAIRAMLETRPPAVRAGVVITGPPLIGKSQLMREVAAQHEAYLAARGAGRHFVAVRCTATTADEAKFSALVRALPALTDNANYSRVLDAYCAAADGGPRWLTLVIDDAHLLDIDSQVVVSELMRRGATMIATARTATALGELMSSQQVAVYTLDALSSGDVSLILSTNLGGPINVEDVPRLHRLVADDPRRLQRLVTECRDAFRNPRGVFEWTGEIPEGLLHKQETTLARLGESVRQVLDLVTIGEPLETRILSQLVSPEALKAAELAGIIGVSTEGRVKVVRLGHPTWGDIARSALPRRQTIVPELNRRLADAVLRDAGPGGLPQDLVMRVGVWIADSDAESVTEADVPVLAAAFQAACARGDTEQAVKMAEAVHRIRPDRESVETLLPLYSLTGVEAPEVLKAARALMENDDDRSTTVAVAAYMFWGQGRHADAIDLLTTARATAPGADGQATCDALLAMTRAYLGDFDQAASLARRVAEDATASQDAKAQADVVRALLDALAGRTDGVLARSAALPPLSSTWRTHIRFHLEFARATARSSAGVLRNDIALDSVPGAPPAIVVPGFVKVFDTHVARMSGHIADAYAHGQQARSLFGSGRHLAGMASAELAQAAALAGLPVEARRYLDEAYAMRGPSSALTGHWTDLAGAAVLVAEGYPGEAAMELRALAASLAAAGRYGIEVQALHGLVRLGCGREVFARLRALWDLVDGRYAKQVTAHAAADGDPVALAAVAQGFADLGMNLYAAEALHTSLSLTAAADRHIDPLLAGRLAELRNLCPGAKTPGFPAPQRLNKAELNVLLRAVSDPERGVLSNREIKEQVNAQSERAVEMVMSRIYKRLHTTRPNLPGALRAYRVYAHLDTLEPRPTK